ncbi:MAG: HlyD family efflux transporter periplasmic adaptor subunit [Sulfobacillus sp.]|nr:HlyD family efflux transporter periplasmic adaptor subunit [Sulfobacillus sp.]
MRKRTISPVMRIVGVGAVGLSLGFGLYALGTVQAASLSGVPVIRGTVVKTVYLAGSVTSPEEVSVSYTGRPTVVTNLAVHVGQTVSAGTVLATLANGQTLTSPMNGTVVASSLAVGQLLPSGASASGGGGGGFGRGNFGGQTVSATATAQSITIANPQDIEVTANASELDIPAIQTGQSVTLIFPGEPGLRYTGTVSAVSRSPVAGSTSGIVSYPVTIHLNTTHQPLPYLGMSAAVAIQAQRETGLVVPIDAVHAKGTGWVVTRPGGTEVPVTLGLVGINRVVVTRGLTPGEVILTPSNSTGQHAVTVMWRLTPGSFSSGG